MDLQAERLQLRVQLNSPTHLPVGVCCPPSARPTNLAYTKTTLTLRTSNGRNCRPQASTFTNQMFMQCVGRLCVHSVARSHSDDTALGVLLHPRGGSNLVSTDGDDSLRTLRGNLTGDTDTGAEVVSQGQGVITQRTRARGSRGAKGGGGVSQGHGLTPFGGGR